MAFQYFISCYQLVSCYARAPSKASTTEEDCRSACWVPAFRSAQKGSGARFCLLLTTSFAWSISVGTKLNIIKWIACAAGCSGPLAHERTSERFRVRATAGQGLRQLAGPRARPLAGPLAAPLAALFFIKVSVPLGVHDKGGWQGSELRSKPLLVLFASSGAATCAIGKVTSSAVARLNFRLADVVEVRLLVFSTCASSKLRS